MNEEQEKPKGLGARNHSPGCGCGFCLNVRRQETEAQAKEAKGIRPRRRLTAKRKRFTQEFSDPTSSGWKNATKAAELAGYSKESAGAIGSQLLGSEQVQSAIWVALEKKGITLDFLAEKHREGLDAMETKVISWQGQVTEKVEVPDHQARAKYLDMIHRLRRDYPREEPQVQSALILRIGAGPLIAGHKDICACDACIAEAERRAEAMKPAEIPDGWKDELKKK